MMKRVLLLALPALLSADTPLYDKKMKQLEERIQLLEKQVDQNKEDLSDIEPILEKTEKKSILDKIDLSPEVELRADKFYYNLGDIAGEYTHIDGNPSLPYRRKDYTKDFELAGNMRFKLNMKAQLDDQVSFHGRMLFNISSQSHQRLCILSRDIKSVSASSVFDVQRAYFDYSPDKNSQNAFTFSFGLLPTSGGTPMQYAQNTKRKSMFPALVFDMNTYGVIATQKLYNKTFLRAIVAKAYTMQAAFYPYQCNRENIDNADVFGVYADTSFSFLGDALLSAGINYLHDLKAHPYLGPDVTSDDAHVLGDMMTLGLGIDIENVLAKKLDMFLHTAFSIPYGNGNVDDYQIVSYSGTTGLTASGITGFSEASYAKGSMVSSNGYAFYAGAKQELSQDFDVGAEYNYGSKYWFSATQGAEDMYNKLATRGHVIEGYFIWKFNKNIYTKLGYMYTKEEYTGSGWHFGEPVSKDGIQQVGYLSINAKY